MLIHKGLITARWRVRLGPAQDFQDELIPANRSIVEHTDPKIKSRSIRHPPQDVVVDGGGKLSIAQRIRIGRAGFILVDKQRGGLLQRGAICKGGSPETQTDRIRRAVEIGNVELDELRQLRSGKTAQAAKSVQVEIGPVKGQPLHFGQSAGPVGGGTVVHQQEPLSKGDGHIL